MNDSRKLLLELLQCGLDAVEGRASVRHYFQDKEVEKVYCVAIGKAAESMSLGLLDVFKDQLSAALLITKHGYVSHQLNAFSQFDIIQAGHPVPDAFSLDAGKKLLTFLAHLPVDAKLVFLISGGASSLVDVLNDSLSLEVLQKINHWLLSSGYDIATMNKVRTQLSAIKGGKLLSHLHVRHVDCLMISDVYGDALETIGSGLLFPANDELPAALPENLPSWIRQHCEPFLSAASAASVNAVIVANRLKALAAIEAAASSKGKTVFMHEEFMSGDVFVAAKHFSETIRTLESGIHVWSSETTVVLPENPGRGGRCQAMALAVAEHLQGHNDFVFMAVGTDGSDGPSDDAGAMVDAETIARGTLSGLDAKQCLLTANAGVFLQASGDLIQTGATGTNVMDIFIVIKGLLVKEQP